MTNSPPYPGEPKPISRAKIQNNRQIIDGIQHLYCRKCKTWKPADDDHFYKLNYGMFGSPCKACSIAAQIKGYCPAPGCGKVLYPSNKSGYCLKHTPRATVNCVDCGKPIRKDGTGRCMQCYHASVRAIAAARKEAPLCCKNCGKEIERRGTSGLCRECYALEANTGRELSSEFYSGLGELPESPGYAISAPGRFWRQR